MNKWQFHGVMDECNQSFVEDHYLLVKSWPKLRLQIFIWDQAVLPNYITLSSSIPWNNLFLPIFNIWVSVDVHLFIKYYVLKRNGGNIGYPVPRHTVQRKVPALLTCTLDRGNNLLTPGKRKSQCQKSTSADDGLSSKNPYCGTVLFWVIYYNIQMT